MNKTMIPNGKMPTLMKKMIRFPLIMRSHKEYYPDWLLENYSIQVIIIYSLLEESLGKLPPSAYSFESRHRD